MSTHRAHARAASVADPAHPGLDERSYVRRVLIAVAIVMMAALLFSTIGLAWHACLTIFGGVLIGVAFDWPARELVVRTRLPRPLALALVGVVLVGATVGFWWWMGPALSRQLEGLGEQLTRAWLDVEARLGGTPIGDRMLAELENLSASTHLFTRLGGLVTTTLGSIGTIVLVLVFGIDFAITPEAYVRGTLHLFPIPHRERLAAAITAVGRALRTWLLARLVSMVFVGVGTAVGLWIIGMPMVLGLGVIAGLLSFVPNVGPLAAAIPGVLIGLSHDPMAALWAIVVYCAVQVIDNYVVTPWVELRMVSIPPAVLLAFQLLMGISGGLVGLFMATPLFVTLVVLVQALYVRDVLGDPVPLLGEEDS